MEIKELKYGFGSNIIEKIIFVSILLNEKNI